MPSTPVAAEQIAVLVAQVRAGRSLQAEALFRVPGVCLVCGALAPPYPSRTVPADCVALCAECRRTFRQEYHRRPRPHP